MELTADALNYLFAPLHMHVKCRRGAIHPYGLYNSNDMIVYSKSTKMVLIEKSIDALWDEIVNTLKFMFEFEQVDGCANPYFNCKSLEQAFIIRDLIA